jgi:L-glyceraldehyde 3-phosphate reductase
VRVTQRMNLTPITIHQPRYNLLDRHSEYTLFDNTRRAGVGVIVYSSLEHRMLTSKYLSEDIPSDSRAAEW